MGNIYSLVLQNEIPKFGSGHRRIEVVNIGHKWVLLAYHGKKQKITIQKWAAIQQASREYHQRAKRGA